MGYGALAADPLRQEALRSKNAELEAQVKHIRESAPGRQPEWSEKMRLQVDKLALHHGKRMILWDDTPNDSGFYLWMNWDWEKNVPAKAPVGREREPGWYAKYKKMFKPKGGLLDTSVGDDKLAHWIDKNTMSVHRFLDDLDDLKRHPDGKEWPTAKGDHVDITSGAWQGILGSVAPMWFLDTPYGTQLKSTEYPI